MTTTMNQPLMAQKKNARKRGFTLIEVIAVLVVLGILAAIALPRYIDMADAARDRAIDSAIAELNGREALAWGQQMLAESGAPTALQVWNAMNTDLEPAATWTWTVAASQTGGTLQFQTGTAVPLTRTAQTSITDGPAVWTRTAAPTGGGEG